MLYESIGGHGQIIGLTQRQSGSTLPCIITQDQTILTEREYDIILHGKLVVGIYAAVIFFPTMKECLTYSVSVLYLRTCLTSALTLLLMYVGFFF